jgi:N-methylhydantoinase A
VPLPTRDLVLADIALIRATYETEYTRLYHRVVPGADIEVLSYEVKVSTTAVAGAVASAASGAIAAGGRGTRAVRNAATGDVTDWQIVPRSSLAEGQTLAGPAIITEAETSTLVSPGWSATRDTVGYIHLNREARS